MTLAKRLEKLEEKLDPGDTKIRLFWSEEDEQGRIRDEATGEWVAFTPDEKRQIIKLSWDGEGKD